MSRVRRLFRSGEPMVWLTGSALAFSLLMVVGLVVLVLVSGLGFFWPADLVRFRVGDAGTGSSAGAAGTSSTVLGRVCARERIPDPGAPRGAAGAWRVQVKQANRDLTGADYVWIDEARVTGRTVPRNAVALERREWGDFYGFLVSFREGGAVRASGEEAWRLLESRLPSAQAAVDAIRSLEKDRIGKLNAAKEKVRLALKRRELKGVVSGPDADRLAAEREGLEKRYQEAVFDLEALRAKETAAIVVADASGREKEVPLSQVVRAFRPNAMGTPAKAALYASRLWSFVSEDPRESNTEGGVFPAIFGTVLMVLLMSVVVTPLGVLAAFYLREYARQGPFVSAVRIAVNNLAGVPSIVFGVFGVGFFVYFVGGTVDRLFFPEALPTPTFGTGGILWASLTLSLLTVPVVIVAAEEGLAAIPRGVREASLALGATKFETEFRVVLPAVMPAVLTGLILAMARAAGEVAPLMITGVVKLAPALPIDGIPPFLHFDRKFMHLGFHVYDVGFQSPNVDAARPMVYMTTILLLVVVVSLNLAAVLVRNRLRRKLRTSGL